ncbi:hypothetical protein [Alteromonas sp. KUL106]|uniref:hypothetical protein n=1 Tax=Alteromonas sp. KUL106 TaxID=2480799 RepID=UPI0012E586FA|nr:hypothetical protein [Alteromonas sp. KUL106]GFD70373.1 hypothetical protein KUL106_36360 [Alteromonas sp. KUL106]
MRFSYALLLLTIGIIVGIFGYSFGIEQLYKALKEHLIFLGVIFLVIIVFIGLLIVYQQKILEFVLGTKRQSLSDVLTDLADTIKTIPVLGDSQQGEKASNALRNGIAIYTSWSLRLIVFRTIVGCTVALCGIFASLILIKQNDVMEKQLGAIEKQTISEAERIVLFRCRSKPKGQINKRSSCYISQVE